jgi:hypothetical protein
MLFKKKRYLNVVYAGPYVSVEAAREFEEKLQANGNNVKIEASDKGYIIVISKTSKLSPALKNMEKYDAMGIAPLYLKKGF